MGDGIVRTGFAAAADRISAILDPLGSTASPVAPELPSEPEVKYGLVT
jgi:hypothetical protein